MYSGDYIMLMDCINIIITLIDKAILDDERTSNYILEDDENSVVFGFKGIDKIERLIRINKVNEDTLKDIYLSIADHYKDNIGIGATMEYKDKNIKWNLAPVIADKVLLEFMSSRDEDQKWFHEEIVKGTSYKKGL